VTVAVRAPGGRYLQRREHRWPGLGLELARWQAGPASEGLCHVREHLLFVTLGGVTARTEARIENGQQYAEARTFPARSRSSPPTGGTRRGTGRA
jgi:AraC family transcriptional regulator